MSDTNQQAQPPRNQAFTKHFSEFTPQEQNDLFNTFHDTYTKATGESWDKSRFEKQARNWTFWGTPKGFVTTRYQRHWKAHKITGGAGSDRDKHLGMKALLARNEPVWTAASPEIVAGMQKHYGFTPLTGDQGKLLAPVLAKAGVLGNWQLQHIDDNGGMHLKHPDLDHVAVKHLAMNDAARERFKGMGLPITLNKALGRTLRLFSDLLKAADPDFSSPVYDALTSASPFGGRPNQSAWINPDGSHETVRSHASTVMGTGETVQQHQKRTGRVGIGVDRTGTYCHFVHSMTPAQHKVVTEFLRAGLWNDKEPTWERADLEIPGRFESRNSSKIPAKYVQSHDAFTKCRGIEEDDLLKAKSSKPRVKPTPIHSDYQLPQGSAGTLMEEGSPEHVAYLKTKYFGEHSHHPGDHGKEFQYATAHKALTEAPGASDHIGLPPQNLWGDDAALLGLMERGKFGQHWYSGYQNGLTGLAKRSGIDPKLILNMFGLHGQSAGLQGNIQGMIKNLVREKAGWHSKGEAYHRRMLDLQIRKSIGLKSPQWANLMHVLHGGDLSTKKLGSYARSLYDPDSTPAIDKWIQRIMFRNNGNDVKGESEAVPSHYTIAATGKINHLRDTWNTLHPTNKVTAAQVQAMLWYGGKHSHGDYLESLADHLDMFHPEVGKKYSTTLRHQAGQVRYDGSWDQTAGAFGLEHPEGLPYSHTHDLLQKLEPGMEKLNKLGLIHTDMYNYHKLEPEHLTGYASSTVKYLQDIHPKFNGVRVVGDHILVPKKSKDVVAEILNGCGVHFNPTQDRSKVGSSKTWVDVKGLKDHFTKNPTFRDGLSTLHATVTQAENTNHPEKVLIGDIGHSTKQIAALAYKANQMPPMEKPISYGMFKTASPSTTVPES